MTRFAVAVVTLLAVIAPAAAQSPPNPQGGGVIDTFTRAYSENHQWPYPYYCYDRQAVHDPFVVMAQNGWRRQNLLADYHFQNAGGQLNDAGQDAVRRIVVDAAALHHPIYVRYGRTAAETAARMAAVEQFAARCAGEGGVPPILATNVTPATYPADWPSTTKGDNKPNVGRQFQVAVPDRLYLPDEDKQGSSGGGK